MVFLTGFFYGSFKETNYLISTLIEDKKIFLEGFLKLVAIDRYGDIEIEKMILEKKKNENNRIKK
jgi:hypothetical protein